MRYVIAFLMLCSTAFGQEPMTVPKIDPSTPWLIAPLVPVIDQTVAPSPAPAPSPDAVPILPQRTMYVLQSDVKFFLIASPAGLVTIRPLPGPRDITGVFIDSAGKDEDRTYSRPFLAIVKAVEGKQGRVELIGVPAAGVSDESGITRILIDIGVAPQPPPGPVDPIDPINPPVVVPTGFRAMFIYEASTAMTREQLHIFNSTKIREYLTAKCAKSAELNQPEWRFWDKDVKVTSKESKTMADMFTALKPEFGNLPLIAIHANGQGRVFPWPETEAATLELLQSYGGK